jgi:hypothetical protein
MTFVSSANYTFDYKIASCYLNPKTNFGRCDEVCSIEKSSRKPACDSVDKCPVLVEVTEQRMTVAEFEQRFWKFTADTRSLDGSSNADRMRSCGRV